MNVLERANAMLDALWRPNPAPVPRPVANVLKTLYCTGREIGQGELNLRAMSLVYTTLLSLVPLLALSFSLLKALGVHNRIEPMLLGLLEPLGTEAPRITGLLIGFVDNVKIGVLGSVGIALLFYTVLAMIKKVESSFNFIWRIARERPMSQRVTEYLVVLLVGPLMISLVIGMTAGISSHRLLASVADMEFLARLAVQLSHLVPYLLITGIFSFVFSFIPNTRVQPRAALIGGLVSGVLWQTTMWGFANFVASASNYNAIYSGFAIVIFLLIWLYLGWLILLIGCQISFLVQHPEYVTRSRSYPRPSPEARDLLALLMMAVVSRRFQEGAKPLSAEQLARATHARPELIYPLLDELCASGMLAETASGGLLPGRDPDELAAVALLDALHDNKPPYHSHTGDFRAVEEIAEKLRAARIQTLDAVTIGELARTSEPRKQEHSR